MPLTVRSAAAQNEDTVASLWRACGLVSGDKDPAAHFRFARGSPCSDVLVGEDEGGRIVASVMVGHDGHRGWLYYVAADPSAWGAVTGGAWCRQQRIGSASMASSGRNCSSSTRTSRWSRSRSTWASRSRRA